MFGRKFHFRLKKIESIERMSRILDAQNHYSDSSVTHKTSQEHYKERAKSKEPTDDRDILVWRGQDEEA
jgi:hypothetical protein